MSNVACLGFLGTMTALVSFVAGPRLVRTACKRACCASSLDLSALPWNHSGESRCLRIVSACTAGVLAALSCGCREPCSLLLLVVCSCLGLAAGAMLESDVAYRLLPYELNFALLLSGAALQIMRGALSSLLFGLVCGLLFSLATVVCHLVGKRLGKEVVGGGDVGAMLATSVVCGDGVLIGALIAFAGTLAWKTLCSIAKKAPWDEAFPMAPVFVVWLVCGLTFS